MKMKKENYEKQRPSDSVKITDMEIADDVRGSIDGWDFKQYVLGTLFYRYISENINSR